MRPKADRTAGFSLIEVLVAFVILTLVVTMCLQVYANSARSEASARWSEKAHALLSDRLAAVESMRLQPGQQLNGQTADGLAWSVGVLQPTGAALISGRGIVRITAQVVDPAGKTWSATTARWRGEGFQQGAIEE
jgi:Tfp pilus assembly protein PilV